ncbi:glycine cleavage system aminomethyltransferase GcvT [Nocardioides sp. GY 10127]|uniref:glycine cleavage system aminomethyltransferase GcvT n=1 Tax=Nocardioides sp. GY 10127 TaxID=2569762 RepID=UPI0010A937F4|nr:glycine cleavage system aminomethyltransferase GcvT [Nocardioides sp. GY 10127]TIC85580.1 glycine cleavage system aminomethyltransferase GcvT [Nocardioides sp. GY 10127]
MALLTSPLHERHVALGAKLGEFGGWSMPLEYADGGVVAEHTAVREAVGLFDVSHLGKATVKGPGAADFVNACLTNDLGRIAPGQAQYTLCCDQTGGVVDDLIVYLHGPDHLLLVPNAANTAEVVRRLQAAAPEGVEVTDEHRDHVVLAVQGPQSDAVLVGAGLPVGHDYMSFVTATFDGTEVVVCRTGYTGERGYELIAPVAVATSLWDALVEAGAEHGLRAAGLGARDTLRTEMGYPLHGQDLSLEITPVQARAAWAIGWDKPTFWGKEALAAERAAKPARVLRGIKAVGRGIPRAHMTVVLGEGEESRTVGEVTSGTFSPTLRTGIGLALVAADVPADARVAVDVRGRRMEFDLVKPPFVDTGVRG